MCLLGTEFGSLREQFLLVTSEHSLQRSREFLTSQLIFVAVKDKVSWYILVCPGTANVDQAGLKFREICLPLLPESWLKGWWPDFFFLNLFHSYFELT